MRAERIGKIRLGISARRSAWRLERPTRLTELDLLFVRTTHGVVRDYFVRGSLYRPKRWQSYCGVRTFRITFYQVQRKGRDFTSSIIIHSDIQLTSAFN